MKKWSQNNLSSKSHVLNGLEEIGWRSVHSSQHCIIQHTQMYINILPTEILHTIHMLHAHNYFYKHLALSMQHVTAGHSSFAIIWYLFYFFSSFYCTSNGKLFLVVVHQHEPVDPCVPNPCGANALCNERNGVGSCICMKDYFGDPYLGCRPECVQNSDCPFDKACFNMRCENPCACIGTCDVYAECSVINHSPVCHCLPGYTGNPFQNCHPVPANSKRNRTVRQNSSFTNRTDFCLPSKSSLFTLAS